MKQLLLAAAVALALIASPAWAQEKKAPAKPAPAAEKKAEALMDINSATEKELATLPGIGEARAKAIVKGRPYKGKDELVAKKIIPDAVYKDVSDKIIAKQGEAPKKDEKKK